MEGNINTKSLKEGEFENNETNKSWVKRCLRRQGKDVATSSLWLGVCAEFLGTYMLCLWANGMGRYDTETGSPPDLLPIAIGVGFIVSCLINTLLAIGSGHMNPALSIAFLIRGEITFLKFVFYVIAQCSGSVAAVLTISQLVPESMHGDLGLHLPKPGVSALQALIVEFWITFGLLFFTNAFIDDKRSDNRHPVPFYLGMAVTANILFAANISGGCMNPAAGFGPALVRKIFAYNWVYWVGPLLGASVGTLVYTKFFAEDSIILPIFRQCSRGKSRDKMNGNVATEQEHMLSLEIK